MKRNLGIQQRKTFCKKMMASLNWLNFVRDNLLRRSKPGTRIANAHYRCYILAPNRALNGLKVCLRQVGGYRLKKGHQLKTQVPKAPRHLLLTSYTFYKIILYLSPTYNSAL